MKIISLSNVLKSEVLTITKSIASIIVGVDCKLNELLNEKISIYIERSNGNNVILANKISLKSFLLASTYGGEAVQSDADFGCIALCELGQLGGIFLDEKESIKIEFSDLRAARKYDVYGIEDAYQTANLFHFEQKSIASEETNKKIDVRGFDLAIMSMDGTISDLSYTYENGQVVKYLPFELQTLSTDVDPVQYIAPDGTVQQRTDGLLAIPLVHVDFIEINKAQGNLINFVVRTVKAV
jgi:hypothetical protein